MSQLLVKEVATGSATITVVDPTTGLSSTITVTVS
jgi:hypothetical protein